MKSKIKYIITLIVLLSFSVTAFFIGRIVGARSGKLDKIQALIDTAFPLEYDKEHIEDMAAKMMVMALNDPYSQYMTREESTLFYEEIAGSYKGVGITIELDEAEGSVIIREVEKESPSDLAGLMAGDVLLYVDDIEAKYENYEQLLYYIKGISEGAPDDETEMKFKVLREGEELEFGLKRARLEKKNVTAEVKDDILIIEFKEFSDTALVNFKNELEKHENYQAMVLDLRDNGGGDLEVLIDIAELLLPKGVLLVTEDAKGNKKEYTVSDDEYYDMPLAILVNENTASASEVLAAAIKERGRGTLVGVTTYGKGLVQAIIPLGDGSTLRLTVEKYYTAGGNYINKVGVEPEIVVEDKDKQLETAMEYLKNKLGK